MNCTDFLAKLTDYFDGQIDPELLTEVKEHLGTCHHCEVVVDTTRQTIDVYRGHQPYEFPEDLSTRLRSAIMDRCRACTPEAAAPAAEPASKTPTR
ncbi:MAG: zf-HC2 domain-containing protein [Acidobacteriota bacterium]